MARKASTAQASQAAPAQDAASKAAAEKAAAEAALQSLLLTSPTPKKGAKTTPKGEVSGMEAQAEEYVVLRQQMDGMEARLEQLRAEIEPKAADARLDAEIASGKCVKSVTVPGTTVGRAILVVYQNKFSKIDLAHEATLRTLLGDDFSQIIARKSTPKVREGVSLDALKAALGDKFAELFDVEDALVVQAEAMEKIAALRPRFNDIQRKTVQTIIDQKQAKASFRTK